MVLFFVLGTSIKFSLSPIDWGLQSTTYRVSAFSRNSSLILALPSYNLGGLILPGPTIALVTIVLLSVLIELFVMEIGRPVISMSLLPIYLSMDHTTPLFSFAPVKLRLFVNALLDLKNFGLFTMVVKL